jgi:uncharacterized protein
MNEKNWRIISHISALSMFVIPFGNILGPLMVWLLKREEFPSVEQEAKESLNFQITMAIILLIGFLMPFRLFLIPIWGIVNIVYIVMASISVSNNVNYRYPFNLRLVV